jgi:hypothetical protein
MSFLDNLENNLKSLETAPEGEIAGRDQLRRDAERARQNAIAPSAEQLKKSPFTAELMSHAVREGHRLRTKVYITWIGATLRMDARERRIELRPLPEGIQAVFLVNNEETRSAPIDLAGDPGDLVRAWLAA